MYIAVLQIAAVQGPLFGKTCYSSYNCTAVIATNAINIFMWLCKLSIVIIRSLGYVIARDSGSMLLYS